MLLVDSANLIVDFTPGVASILRGEGEDVFIRRDMIKRLNRVWDGFAAEASPDLKAVLAEERARFHGFEDFIGSNFSE